MKGATKSARPGWLPRIKRGVYWSPATKDGMPIAFAVDSHGDEIERICASEATWISQTAIVDRLWDLLDAVDPIEPGTRVLVLELVR